jgi:hypothetical protein
VHARPQSGVGGVGDCKAGLRGGRGPARQLADVGERGRGPPLGEVIKLSPELVHGMFSERMTYVAQAAAVFER